MKQLIRYALVASLAVAPFTSVAHAEGMKGEMRDHPRLAAAIREMEDAIKYMEAAPHDFGGHKAEAIRATREAVAQLKMALEYRAVQDTKKGK
jgi:hypothetical protein